MNAQEVALRGSSARRGLNPTTLRVVREGRENLTHLTRSQSVVLDCLRTFKPCTAAQIVDAGFFPSENAVARHIHSLRKVGYQITTHPGLSCVRGTSYSLVTPMTTRTFGGYTVRIIGPQAHITGPHAPHIIAGAVMLRNLAGSSRIKPAQAEAYAWAIEQLEGAE